MERFVSTSTDDNIMLDGLLYESESKTDSAALFIHGINGNFYQDKFIQKIAELFVDHSLSFLSVNTRGHDYIADLRQTNTTEKRKGGSAYEVFSESLYDLKAWIDFLEQHQYSHIILLGHSLGSSKSVNYLAKAGDERVKKLGLISPTPLAILTKDPAFETNLATAQEFIQSSKGADILPQKILGKLFMSATSFINYHTNKESQNIFNLYDSSQPSLLSSIAIPIFTIWGSEDKYKAFFPIEGVVKYVEQKADHSPEVTSRIIENAGHSYGGFEEELVSELLNWIQK